MPGGDDWFDNNPGASVYGEGNRGLFTKGTSDFDLKRALLLGIGQTWGHEGPNQAPWAFTDGVGWNRVDWNYFQPFDLDFEHLLQRPATWGGLLEFDFCPGVDSVTFDYVFASEEYPEYINVSGTASDVFGFFVTGNEELLSTKVWGGQGVISLSSEREVEAKIYNPQGTLVQTVNLSGTKNVSLLAGLYIVEFKNGYVY